MEIRQLQYFISVAEQLSFSKAAEMLYVTQPLLSQQIADLERQLGTELFIRNRRSVSLTPAGTALYREATAIFRQMNQAMATVRNAAESVGIGGELRLGFEHIYPRRELTDGIARFRLAYPKTNVRLSRYSSGQQIYLINRGQLDVGFFTFPTTGFDSDCDYRLLRCGWMSVAVSPHLVQETDMETARRVLEEYPLYLVDKDARELNRATQVCRELNVTPSLNFAADVADILADVECGQGVTIVDGDVLSSYGSAHLTAIPLEGVERARSCIVAVWKRTNGNALIPLLLDSLSSEEARCRTHCGKRCALDVTE